MPYITAQSRDVLPYTGLERKQPFEKDAILFTFDQVCGQIRKPLLDFPEIWQIPQGLWADARRVCAYAHGRCGYAVQL